MAEKLGATLTGALMLKSPKEQDANDLLRTGQLDALLERVGIEISEHSRAAQKSGNANNTQ